MSGVGRWWGQPQRRNVRPAVRARRRNHGSDGVDAGDLFELGYRAGQADFGKQVEKILDGDPLAVAEAVGVTPLADVDGEQLVDELERWLREQG